VSYTEVVALLTSIGARKILDGCGAGPYHYTPLVPFSSLTSSYQVKPLGP